MGSVHRASAVETLLARLSGEVAPLWVTFGAVVDGAVDVPRLRAALGALVAGTPRLQLVWEEPAGRWRRVRREAACVRDALRIDLTPAPHAEVQAAIISSPVELGEELPLRVHYRALEGAAGPFLLAFQLHHAVGDARALGRAVTRLWGLYARPGSLEAPWGGAVEATPDAWLVGHLARTAPRWLGALGPSSLLLAPRGASLPRDGDTLGPPLLQSARRPLEGSGRRLGAPFTAAVLGAIAQEAQGEVLRLRTPVDLAAALGLEGSLANTCMAIPLEVPRAAALQARQEPGALLALARAALGGAIARGVPQVAMLECLLTARLISRARLRRNARPGLLAARRTNTLVVTYVGVLDDIFVDVPARIVDAWGHTPTWGVNAFALGGALYVNATGFAGLNAPWRLKALADAVAAEV